MRFAVIASPHARAARDPSFLRELRRVTTGHGLLLSPSTEAELAEELRALRGEDLAFLACAGGDGSVSRFTTALLRVWDHDRLPPVLLLHGGTMNTISKSLGGRGAAAIQLEAVAKAQVDALPRTRRWPLQVGERRWGYLFGTGIIPRYIQAYEASDDPSPRQAARTLASLVTSAALGRDVDFFAPQRADIRVDGDPWPMKEWLLVAAGAVDDMGLRFRPFHGLLDAPGKLGVFASASRPWRFATDLLPFRLARPARHSLAFHALGEELQLVAQEPIVYNLDGDVETAGTTLTLRSGPAVTFLLTPDARPTRNSLGP